MQSINRINALIFIDSRDMLGILVITAENMWLMLCHLGIGQSFKINLCGKRRDFKNYNSICGY